MTTKIQRHADYLVEMYKQSGNNKNFADELYRRIVKSEKLTVAQASALAQKFQQTLKGGSMKKNPAKRKGTTKPRRVSQITKRPPTKRLVARRRANVEPGYFPNPIADKLAIWLNAGNDSNGNPRRLYVAVDTQGEVLSIHDEGFSGSAAVTDHYPGIAIVGQFHITPAQYRELKKVYKGKFHAS